MLVWSITTGELGMKSQAMGLAEALDPNILVEKNVTLPKWILLPGNICPYPSLWGVMKRNNLIPPWPDVLVSCGRRSIPFALRIKKRSMGKTFIAHVQDPKISPKYFDLVVAPKHDSLDSSPNVIHTDFAIHKVTDAKLAAAGREFSRDYEHLPRPLLGVLLGGNSRHYRFTKEKLFELIYKLKLLLTKDKVGIIITASRRTGRGYMDILRKELAKYPVSFYSEGEKNPYLGILALSDYLLVTGESVSMVSEVCFTGKPVYIFELSGYGKRVANFCEHLIGSGIVKKLGTSLEFWRYKKFDEKAKVAETIKQKMLMK